MARRGEVEQRSAVSREKEGEELFASPRTASHERGGLRIDFSPTLSTMEGAAPDPLPQTYRRRGERAAFIIRSLYRPSGRWKIVKYIACQRHIPRYVFSRYVEGGTASNDFLFPLSLVWRMLRPYSIESYRVTFEGVNRVWRIGGGDV